MVDETVSIRGIREGLLVTIKSDGGDWQQLVTRFLERVDNQPGFFKGARIALDVGNRPLLRHEIDNLRALLTKREITLWAVMSTSETTTSAARGLSLETALVAQEEQLEAPEINPEEAGTIGVMINHTLRSGRTVRSNGHVVVYGDVNPGAQIIANGSIIVWGRLRGTVHAGASGDEQAVVCALDLAPTQLRIANFITVSPPDKRRKPTPEVASVRQGRIVAESWSMDGR